ncbi:MAG: amidohydrolase [Woeseiaceae bacterium]|jgi:predicted amidohydrolase YtcJ|nr:amidohydrolase [Woeseiaceae bacterium]
MNRIPGIIVLMTAAALLVAGCGSAKDDDGEKADTVIVDALVVTLDDEQPRAGAVAIRDGRIVYVGDKAGTGEWIGPATKMIGAEGRLVLPGFIDTHVHPLSGGGYATALSLDTFGTVDDWLAAIETYAAENADRPILFGYGFLASTFGPAGPTRQQIDAIVPDKPVLIMDEGFHGAWANTATLEALNITQDTPDPVPGFSYYKRDENGDATGYLLEGTAGMAMDALDVITEDVVVEGTGLIVDIMNAYGVTAAFDAGAGQDGERVKTVLDRLEADGALTLRLVGSYRPAGADEADVAVENAKAWAATVKGDNYHYNVLKIMDDGTVEGRTAAMFEDYQGEPGNSGETVFTEEQMTSMISGAAAENIDVHVHALGERAIHETLNAIEAARAAHPDTDSRFAICHIQVITDQDLDRFAELDVIAQSTPLWASYDEYGEQFVSVDQFSRYWRYKSLKERGVRLTFGSDYPASGAGTLGMSPVVQIEIGHTRQLAGQPDARVQPRESERLDIETLVRGFTLDAAYQLRMEDEIGSIETGKYADLVMLDQDIFEVDPYTIHETGVVMTMLGGEIVYAAD